MGFNLRASKAIGSEDRESLERILRYMGRPPLSSERLNMAPDGANLILTLKSAWRNGTTRILLSPFDLLSRLVALIPYPRKNQIRYHGFLAPNSALRSELIDRGDNCGYSDGEKIYRPPFAELMSRVFDIDILECPRCYSRMQLISYIQDNKTTKKILESLKMSTAPPSVYRPEEYQVNYEIEAHPIQDKYWDNP